MLINVQDRKDIFNFLCLFFFFSFKLAAEASIRETSSRPHVIQMRHAGSMQPMYRRDAGVWHQTRSLLYKNLLIKWRTKQQSLQVISFLKTDTRRLFVLSSRRKQVYSVWITSCVAKRRILLLFIGSDSILANKQS